MLINSPNISGSLKVTGNTVVTGSLTVLGTITGAVAGTTATASYVEYSNIGNKPTLISGSSQVTYSGLTGIPSGIVSGSIFSGSFIGDGSQLSGVTAGFPFTGSAQITGSLGVTGSITATTFIGDGSQLTGIADPTPITATVNTTNSPFTVTSQSIVIVDSINGNVTINLPDLDTIVGTSDQRPILIYKNDYSQNVVYVQPSGSQLVNGTTQDIIVSLQIGIVYNPTSAGWVTEGNSYQSLAELELFFVPRTETGSLSVATASYVEYTDVVNKPTLVSGSSQISFSGITNKPTLVSGSSQVTYSGLTGIPSGIVSSSVQVKEYNVFATTGSNQFNGNQSITGSLTVSGQVVAQTLNVQQVTSSIVYSSGSNIFGNSISNVQQFTGSISASGSMSITPGITVTGDGSNDMFKAVRAGNTRFVVKNAVNTVGINTDTINNPLTVNGGADFSGNVGIGITSPSTKLHVYEAATNSTAYLTVQNNRSRNAAIQTTTTNGSFLAGTSIGTDTFNYQIYDNVAGSARLTISSTGAATFSSSVRAGSWLTVPNNFGLEARNAADTAGRTVIKLNTSNQIEIGNDTDISAIILGTTTERMRITSGGNVGIGSTSPSEKLEVQDGYISTYHNVNLNDAGYGVLFYTNGGGSKNSLASIVLSQVGTARTGNLLFTTSNAGAPAERMRITSGGNVLIGTTTDNGSRLQVSGTAYFSSNVRINGNDLDLNNGSVLHRITNDNTNLLIRADYGNDSPNSTIQFSIDGTERLRITSGGNVGIGVDNPSIYKLQVNGAAGIVSTANAAIEFGIRTPNATFNDSFLIFGTEVNNRALIRVTGSSANSGNMIFTTFDSGNGLERMRITSGGNVGIGTTSPSQKLEVNGRIRVSTNGSNGGDMGVDDGGIAFSTQGATPIAFWRNNYADHSMRITSGGNVQINTTNSPTARLHIADALVSTMLRLRSNNDTSTSIIFTSASPGGGSDNYTINHSMIHGSGQGYQISHDVTARWIRMIAGTGGVELAGAATSWTSISDIRKKDVLQTGISNALDKIDSIDAIFYKYKNEELLQDGETLPDGIVEPNQPIKIKQRRIGLIAQQIQEVLPEAVTYNEEEDTYRLSYTEIIPLLVESIKELKAEIQTLKQ